MQKFGGGYEGKPSIFDNIKKDDLILAFFPCIRFEDQILLMFRGQAVQQKKWSLRQKMELDMGLMSELKTNYELVNMLFIACIDRGLRLIMENPYSEQHFLKRYWCFKSALVDMDRRDMGDYYKKPTQYWFLNCEPRNNFLFEPIEYNASKNAIHRMYKEYYQDYAKTAKEARSMIHPTYANRFIRTYILEDKNEGDS